MLPSLQASDRHPAGTTESQSGSSPRRHAGGAVQTPVFEPSAAEWTDDESREPGAASKPLSCQPAGAKTAPLQWTADAHGRRFRRGRRRGACFGQPAGLEWTRRGGGRLAGGQDGQGSRGKVLEGQKVGWGRERVLGTLTAGAAPGAAATRRRRPVLAWEAALELEKEAARPGRAWPGGRLNALRRQMAGPAHLAARGLGRLGRRAGTATAGALQLRSEGRGRGGGRTLARPQGKHASPHMALLKPRGSRGGCGKARKSGGRGPCRPSSAESSEAATNAPHGAGQASPDFQGGARLRRMSIGGS